MKTRVHYRDESSGVVLCGASDGDMFTQDVTIVTCLQCSFLDPPEPIGLGFCVQDFLTDIGEASS